MLHNIAERRHQDRLNLVLKVFERDTGDLLGATENIHCGGMMLMSVRPFNIGEDIDVTVELPTEDETKKLAFTAKSCWCSLDEENSLHSVGFCFVYLNPEMKRFYETLFDGLAQKLLS